MAQMACHIKKHSKNGIVSLERHIFRKNGICNSKIVRPELSHLNHVIIPLMHDSLGKTIFARIAQRENPEQTIRKDAVVLCEALVSSSIEFFQTLSEGEIRLFFEKSADFLRRRYGDNNCMFAVMHMDETIPHMHFAFVPMTSQNRLSAKQIMHRTELFRLQSELPAYMKASGFKIERGQDGGGDPDFSFTQKTVGSGLRLLPTSVAEELSALDQSLIAQLQRENQCLQLEKILLERQIKELNDVINSSPELGALLSEIMAQKAERKREQLMRKSVDLGLIG